MPHYFLFCVHMRAGQLHRVIDRIYVYVVVSIHRYMDEWVSESNLHAMEKGKIIVNMIASMLW